MLLKQQVRLVYQGIEHPPPMGRRTRANMVTIRKVSLLNIKKG